MAERPLVIGAVAYAPKVVTVWDLMREYLGRKGLALDYVLYCHYDGLVQALLDGHVDIAWNTNLAFARLRRVTGGTARAVCMRDSDLDFRTLLVTRRGSGIAGLDDLRGRTLALGSADSMQAAILPCHYLREVGVDPEREVRLIRFDSDVGRHGDTGTSERQVLDAVLAGDADAGALSEYMWLRLAAEVGDASLEIAWTSPGYSHCVLTALDDLDHPGEAELVRLLTTMDPAEPVVRELMDVEEFRTWRRGSAGLPGYEVIFDALQAAS